MVVLRGYRVESLGSLNFGWLLREKGAGPCVPPASAFPKLPLAPVDATRQAPFFALADLIGTERLSDKAVALADT